MHQRWIVDFKVDIQLSQGLWVHLHTVRDPVGAYFPGAELYPAAGKHSKVSEAQVRQTLRHSFAEHGLPEEIQTDREGCLHAKAGDNYPSLFTLWLVGLGIIHHHGRPGVPTDEAEVERGHRTLFEYALADQLSQPLEVLQQHLPLARHQLNEEYPSRAHGCHSQPPILAHPEVLQPLRPFDPQQERAFFDLQRVDRYLAGFCFERKVGKTGQVTLGGKPGRYDVGRRFAGQVVHMHFDLADRCFVATCQEQEIRRWKAKHLEAADILEMDFPIPAVLPV